jgi:hypothetical protein
MYEGTVEAHSLHNVTNDSGQQHMDFATKIT